MKHKSKIVVGIVAGALTLTACGGGAEPSGDGPGGSITLYTSEPQEKIDEIISAFNEHYPDIGVEVFRAGTGDLTARVETEITAEGSPQADVFLAADVPTFEGYVERDLFLQYTPEDVEALLPEVVDEDGYYVGTRVIPTVIAYNTNSIDAPPASWDELTDPQYLDQLVMPNPDVSGAAAFNAAVWLDHEDLGVEWLTDLAENNPVIADSNGPVAQSVASGAQPVGIVVDYLVRDLAEAGSPIAVSYPAEGVPYVSQPVGIFANTEEEELSQLFVDFLVSAEGQELAVGQAYLPVRDDVGTPEGAPAMEEIELLNPDLEHIASIREDSVATFNELFN